MTREPLTERSQRIKTAVTLCSIAVARNECEQSSKHFSYDPTFFAFGLNTRILTNRFDTSSLNTSADSMMVMLICG